uniref:Bromo adjacent domain-containing 1 protein n=1 Tax=Steinernema glaseri TaxID=37863 RepID=A0A1I8AGH3_9BILA
MATTSGASSHDQKRRRKSLRSNHSRKATMSREPQKVKAEHPDAGLYSMKGVRNRTSKGSQAELKPVAPNMSTTSMKGSRKTRKDKEREKEKESDENEPTVFEEISTPIRPASQKHGSRCGHKKRPSLRNRLCCEDEKAKMIPAPTDDTPKFIDPDLKKEQLSQSHSEDDQPKAKPLSKFLQMQAKLRARQKAKEAALKKQTKQVKETDDKTKSPTIKPSLPLPTSPVPALLLPAGHDDSGSASSGVSQIPSTLSTSNGASKPRVSVSQKRRPKLSMPVRSASCSSTSALSASSTTSGTTASTGTGTERSTSSSASSECGSSSTSSLQTTATTRSSSVCTAMTRKKKKELMEEHSCGTPPAHQFSGLPILSEPRILAKALRKKNGRSHREPTLPYFTHYLLNPLFRFRMVYGHQVNSECCALIENPRAVAVSRLKPKLRKKIVIKPLPVINMLHKA